LTTHDSFNKNDVTSRMMNRMFYPSSLCYTKAEKTLTLKTFRQKA